MAIPSDLLAMLPWLGLVGTLYGTPLLEQTIARKAKARTSDPRAVVALAKQITGKRPFILQIKGGSPQSIYSSDQLFLMPHDASIGDLAYEMAKGSKHEKWRKVLENIGFGGMLAGSFSAPLLNAFWRKGTPWIAGGIAGMGALGTIAKAHRSLEGYRALKKTVRHLPKDLQKKVLRSARHVMLGYSVIPGAIASSPLAIALIRKLLRRR